MKRYFGILSLAITGAAFGVIAACDTPDATHAVVDNAYPAPAEGADPASQTVVYRAWWVASYFQTPVPAGTSSEEQRSVPVTGTAYAVLAPGWDPASETLPTKLVFVQSKAPLSVERGGTLHITVSDDAFTGNCAANQPLSQADADFITQSIFPGELTNGTYDAATCTITEADADAGADGDADAYAETPDAADASADAPGDAPADAADAG